MAKIIGNTTATPNPQSDWNQADETKADYIKNKPTILTEEDVVELIISSNMDSGRIPVVYTLPTNANDGDLCIYSPANVPTVENSGKLIYVDWDVFNQTFSQEDFTQFTITFFDVNGIEVGSIYATSWNNSNGGYDSTFDYVKGNEQWNINFAGGIFDTANSYYTNGETTINLTEAPVGFILPVFSSLENDHYNIDSNVFYAPIKLMVYRGGWYEYSSASTVDINIYHGHTLPQKAKEGDLCLYAKPNILTLADSGNKIYFDWNEFSRPVDEGDETELMAQVIKINGDEENTLIRFSRNSNFCECFIEDTAAETLFQAWFTGGAFDFAHYGDTEYNSIEEIPTCYQLPQFDEFAEYSLDGNAYLFHSEYELMKYQGGEWSKVADSNGLTDRIISAQTTAEIKPNTDYVFNECETLAITLADGKENKRNEYIFSFTSGATPTVLTLPDTVKWVNELTIEANKRYEISIVDNIALWCAVEVDV